MSQQERESYELLRRSSTDSESSYVVNSLRPSSLAGQSRSFALWHILGAINLLSYFQHRLTLRVPPVLLGNLVRNSKFRRRSRIAVFNVRLVPRLAASLVIFLFILSVIRAIVFPSYQRPPPHYNALRDTVAASNLPGRGNPHHEKIFIAANILQAELIRGPWGSAVLELVDLLGEGNVFLSIYENDSGPETAAALEGLRKRLRCKSSIVTGAHLSLDGFPTVALPSGEKRIKRITYLAEVRNRALRPLDHAYDPSHPSSAAEEGFRHASGPFDRILFLNDIYFSPLSALQLLFSTNLDPTTRKPSYQAACAIDFIGWAMFYDTFVVRDLKGYGMGLMFFPWFTPSGKAESRNAVLAGKDAVAVKSCWGGMIALQAAPLQKTFSGSTNPTNTEVLRFRSELEPYWEASECCLLLADMTAKYPSADLTKGTGIYINPFVRVAYKPVTYAWIPFVTRYERFFAILQNIISRIGYPEYNPRRTDRAGEEVERKMWVYDESHDWSTAGSGAFRTVKTIAEPGGFCGQKRLFAMLDMHQGVNKGGKKNWEKLPIPPR